MKAPGRRLLRLLALLTTISTLAVTARTAFVSVSVDSFFAYATVFFPLEINAFTPLMASGLTRQLTIEGTADSDAGLTEVVMRFKNTYDVNLSSMSISYPLTQGATTFAFTVPPEYVTSEGVQYRVEARDVYGQVVTDPPQAGEYLLANVSGYEQQTVGPSGGSVVIRDPNSADGDTVLDIPAGALDKDVVITMEELSGVTTSAPIARGAAAPSRAVTVDSRFSAQAAASFRLEPEGLTFLKPVTLRMVYPDVDQDGKIDTDGSDENSLRIFTQTSNGGWNVAGTSIVDKDRNEIRTHLRHFSVYGAFPAVARAPEDYRTSQKVFTPGRVDGFNDTLDFDFLSPSDEVEIFDGRGARIKTLNWPFNWDGRDESGRVVEGGLYMYQFKKDGETVSGVFAVAK